MMRNLTSDMLLMVACRIGNLAVGLLMIPLLLHFLGGEQFAGWALYIAFGLAFTTFEAVTSNTMVRFIAPSAHNGSREEISRIMTNVAVILVILYAALFPLVATAAGHLSRWLYLPGSALLSPHLMIPFIYGLTTLRALLILGQQIQFAGGNFRWFSLASFVQASAGNVAAVVAAGLFYRADTVIMASWAVQLAILASYAVVSRLRFDWSFRSRYIDGGTIRKILGHALPLQLGEWANFFNYQFDKFLIAGMVGLWAVGPYEVANRATLALRSVPASALDLLLPTASADLVGGRAAADMYRETVRYASFGALFFIGAPLAAGWFFLFAWAGETGFYARWAFPSLAGGAMAAVIALPAALLLQVEGRPEVQARAGGLLVLVNLPLSLLLIPHFGGAGAALANGAATTAGAAFVIYKFHRLNDLSLSETLSDLWGTIGRPFLVVAAIGICAAAAFKIWFTPINTLTGHSGSARVFPAFIAVLLCGLCALTVACAAGKRLDLHPFAWLRLPMKGNDAAARPESGDVRMPFTLRDP